jgi:serine phosphatase RsbU (regulator of sigma subunit)
VGGARVLVVDDEAATRRSLTRALERLGFAVETAATGAEALAKLEAAPPDLVVLDFELPDMDGAQLCLQLRKHSRAELAEIPVVFLTGHSGDEEQVRCLEAGANDFVTKPVSLAVLQARIHTQLRLRAMRTELQRQNAELEEWRRVRELDLEAAQATQRAIIPARPPEVAGWDVAAFYQPLIQVGGDAFGWQPLDRTHWLFWIADATGHGASAALLTSLARVLFQHAAGLSKSPAEILRLFNDEFYAVFAGRSFLTAACVAVRTDKGSLVFASAGHPPLLIARRDGGIERIEAGGPLIGLGQNIEVTEARVALDPGDTALLYTDGLFSVIRPGGEHMDFDELLACFRRAERAAATIEGTLRAVAAAAEEPEFSDDTAIIALQRK